MAATPPKLDDKALRELVLASPELRTELLKHAKAAAARANATLTQRQDYPDYDTGVTSGDHPIATVYTRSNHAKYSNAIHQTLAKILG